LRRLLGVSEAGAATLQTPRQFDVEKRMVSGYGIRPRKAPEDELDPRE